MRWFALTLLLLQDGSEKLLKSCDDLLVKAKTVSVTFTAVSTVTRGKQKTESKSEGTFRFKPAALYRFDGKTTVEGVTTEGSLVSDGEMVQDSQAPNMPRAPMKNASERLATCLSRLGMHTAASLSLQNKDRDDWEDDEDYIPDLRRLVKWSDISAKAKEKVGDREALQIVMTATWRKQAEEVDSTATVTTWLDVKTGLPLKRLTRHVVENRIVRVEETYSDWKLDAEMADDVFKIEKK